MNKDITHYIKSRYSTKAFNPNKKISTENIEKIKELLRFSPSSTNAQPWHFIIASTDEAKEKIAKSAEGIYQFNKKAILNASHVIIFCSKTDLEEDFLLRVLNQEDKDGRFSEKPEFKQSMHDGRSMFINMHKDKIKDLKHWIEKQVYINLGAFLLGVSTLDIDALAMEGFDSNVIDKEFSLNEKGYSSSIVIPIGYRDSENDHNFNRPKSRLPYSEILTEI